MSTSPVHLSDALQLDDKSVVDVVCYLNSVEVKAGKTTYYRCKFTCDVDPRCHTYGSAFIKYTPEGLTNTKVLLRGAEIGSYNGRKQVTVGKRGEIISYVSDLEQEPQAQPVRQNAPSAAGTPAIARPAASQVPVVFGATVGMAVNNAVQIWLEASKRDGATWDHDSLKEVYQTASDLIRISQALEAGKLAPKAGEQRQAPQTPTRGLESLDEPHPF